MSAELKRTIIPIAVEGFSVTHAAVSVSDSPKQPDLMYISFILCHEGPNANGDYFSKEILQAQAGTAINKPIDVEHTFPCIGVITHSEFVDGGSDPSYIRCQGVVWKYFYTEQAAAIEKNYASGKLKVSMECYFKECDFLVGDRVISEDDAARLHVDKLKGFAYQGFPVYRRFKDAIFGGVGVVANPADKDAVILSVASMNDALNRYHDLLHFWYDNEDPSCPLNDDQIVEAHRQVHAMLEKIGACV